MKVDTTAPEKVKLNPSGTSGSNGWFTSDVDITTTGEDSVSGIASCTAIQHQTEETTGKEFTGSCTNNAGLTTKASLLSVKLDKTEPSAALSAEGDLGDNDWYISNVKIITSGSDDISSPVTCISEQVLDSDTEGETFDGSCTNDAGLSTNASSLTIKRDATAPTITATAKTVDEADYSADTWTNQNVTVSFSCYDELSGVSACSPFQTISEEGELDAVKGTVTDKAGNSAETSFGPVKIDKSAPVTISDAPDGWKNTDVTVTFSPTNSFSGVSKTYFTVNGGEPQEGTNVEISDEGTTNITFWSVDNVGNVETANKVDVQIDKTKPVISTSSLSFALNQSPAVISFTCTDSLSGIQSCPKNLTVDTSKIGTFPFTVEAKDNAGNIEKLEGTYNVHYNICVLYDQTKSHKSGSTVPVKLQLCDANGANVSASNTVVTSSVLLKKDSDSSSLVEDSGNANPDSNFRYDPTLGTTGGYIFNLSTKGLTSGTWKLQFKVDGVTGLNYFVTFDVK